MTQAAGIVGEFLSLKRESDADLLAMQCGDFYEFFAEDAEIVGEELDLKVSQKSSHGSSYPMAGVPVDDLTPYLKALVERGYRVAVADQYETDSGHAREVVRVVTPGTLLEATDASARYVATIVADETLDAVGRRGSGSGSGGSGESCESGDSAPGRSVASETGYGLAFADVTTGQFLVADTASRDETLTELYRFDPVEVLPGPTVRDDGELCAWIDERLEASVTLQDAEAFAPGRARHRAREHFGEETVDRLAVGESAVVAAGAVLTYVEETGAGVLASMTRIRAHRGADHVSLDATTQRNLELTETMHGEREGSLFATIDHTVTSPGGRLLAEWLCRPRRTREALQRRAKCIEALAGAALAREEIREELGVAYDLERLASKATHGSADARDLLAVRDTLGVLPRLARAVTAEPTLADSPLSDVLAAPDREAAADLEETLSSALAEEPPSTVTEGGLLSRGYHDELDGLIDHHEDLKRWFSALAERESRQYDLSHVTVDRNRTDGYYVQVGKSAADGVPDHYEEIKTLKNSKRFRTEELAEKERELLRLEERRGDLEYELFCELRETVAEHAETLQDVGRAVARLDVLASLATHAAENGWVRPTLRDDDVLEIGQGRHPVVEQTTDFVPNDVHMDPDRSFLIVTGPNMSGKSTYMRQVACIVLLAQIGSFVPARSAEIGLVDGIFTRVGALDELAQGRSTFMVEMNELSNILHNATADSLVILDEVGRGTSTYDGVSIAWAATEYLHNEVRAKTLFATHYHELTELAAHLPRVGNVHVAADERDGTVTFLRTVRDGPTDRSYGIHVADLAGVPEPVVERARSVLERLREEKPIEARGAGSEEPVQAVFDLGSGAIRMGGEASSGPTPSTNSGGAGESVPREAADESARPDPTVESVLSELESIDVNESAPIDVLAKVQEWQTRLDDE